MAAHSDIEANKWVDETSRAVRTLFWSFLEEIGLKEGQESIYLAREDGNQGWEGGTYFAKS